ncbi:hypothetical protein Gohar_014022 [Gossypium harknessii]|uniref:Uncharacterized protein n=1 Tax=Gossypium harknessii TaxID=34285 RepID=A0A7J9H4I5_9ROSI|nr:hypothetical protein [Gossypium harknessii]
MERKSCCGSGNYVCTPKKQAMVTPKKEEDVKPDITKGSHHAAPVPVPAAVVKVPKKEENETVSVKNEASKPNVGCGGCN